MDITLLPQLEKYYHIVELIGSGYRGIVYKVEKDGFYYVAKFPPHNIAKNDSKWSRMEKTNDDGIRVIEEYIDDIFEEAASLSKLTNICIGKDCPFPIYYGLFSAERKLITEFNILPVIIMEKINGITLKKITRKLNGYDILLQLLKAVKILHDNNMTHGDLHSDNTMITPEDKLILIDIGGSTQFSEQYQLSVLTSLLKIDKSELMKSQLSWKKLDQIYDITMIGEIITDLKKYFPYYMYEEIEELINLCNTPQLKDRPNIDKLIDLLLDMSVNGITLDKITRNIDGYDILIQILKTVQKIHHEGFIHGDIKPSNILITNEDEVFLIDSLPSMRDFKKMSRDDILQLLNIENIKETYRRSNLELNKIYDIICVGNIMEYLKKYIQNGLWESIDEWIDLCNNPEISWRIDIDELIEIVEAI